MTDFNLYYTFVLLQDSPSYSTQITLDGKQLNLSFVWNERLGRRVLSITDYFGNCYLQNTALYPNEFVNLNSTAILNDLNYSVQLQRIGGKTGVGDIYNWSKDFMLYFFKIVDIAK